jgi:hypothetical protein
LYVVSFSKFSYISMCIQIFNMFMNTTIPSHYMYHRLVSLLMCISASTHLAVLKWAIIIKCRFCGQTGYVLCLLLLLSSASLLWKWLRTIPSRDAEVFNLYYDADIVFISHYAFLNLTDILICVIIINAV